MLGQIICIDENTITLKLNLDVSKVQNLINLFVLINDNNRNLIGEIVSIKDNLAFINLLGEYKNNDFTYGVVTKPSFASRVSLLAPDYLNKIISYESDNERNNVLIGKSSYYHEKYIKADINNLFGNHFSIMGSTGSGKSCGFTRLIQNAFLLKEAPVNANFLIFDAYAEYHNAFKSIEEINPNLHFKAYTTDLSSRDERICFPLWLLDVDDISLMLGVKSMTDIPIVEKALKYVNLFTKSGEEIEKMKNSIIAKALIDILISGRQATQIRDQFIAVLGKFNTPTLNLETEIVEPGYVRTFRQCLLIDQSGKIQAIEKVNDFLNKYLIDDIDISVPDGSTMYTLNDLVYAFDFAMIDEGILKNESVYNRLNYISVRLDNIVKTERKLYFEYPNYVNLEEYIKKLTSTARGENIQIVNFNINNVDDRFAKFITKTYSKMFFKYAKNLEPRASRSFNLILEEAHRYVQNDSDVQVLGYNIFDRISKEGRKYGVLLGLITQRPSELSETVVSQCSNFFLFRMVHPTDLEFIQKIVPNISETTLKRMQTIPSGNCTIFGTAFKMPSIVEMDMPNPAPSSNTCKISETWF